MIDISVVVPAYNVEKTVRRTLDALVEQTAKNIEIVVINDGSTDGTASVLERYQEEHECVRVFHVKNGGVYRARLEGAWKARGAYIGFCDADDVPDKQMYEKLLTAAVCEKADMAVCAYVREDMDSGKVMATEMTMFGNRTYQLPKDADILPVINTAQWNKIIRAELVHHAIDFEKPPRVLEDMMFLASIYPYMKRIAFVSEPLYHYRVHAGSAMSCVSSEELGNIEFCMQRTRKQIVQANEGYARIIDTMAFIHFGLSVVLRRVQSGEKTKEVVRRAEEYLYTHHPLWIHAGNGLIWNLKHGNLLLKPLIARYCFRMKMMGPMLACYRFVIEKLKMDIKW